MKRWRVTLITSAYCTEEVTAETRGLAREAALHGNENFEIDYDRIDVSEIEEIEEEEEAVDDKQFELPD